MRNAIAVLVLVGVCLRSVAAMDGIAISTHRIGGNDAGPGVHMSMFGNIIRHEIRNGRVAESRVLYKGKARGAVINQRGNKVAFLKLDGRAAFPDGCRITTAMGTSVKIDDFALVTPPPPARRCPRPTDQIPYQSSPTAGSTSAATRPSCATRWRGSRRPVPSYRKGSSARVAP